MCQHCTTRNRATRMVLLSSQRICHEALHKTYKEPSLVLERTKLTKSHSSAIKTVQCQWLWIRCPQDSTMRMLPHAEVNIQKKQYSVRAGFFISYQAKCLCFVSTAQHRCPQPCHSQRRTDKQGTQVTPLAIPARDENLQHTDIFTAEK